jgi:predicted RNase H-like HicB family nuclease
MRRTRWPRRRGFRDTCVIYESKEDGCWIAHSLCTDQIGAGESVVEALVELMRAIEGLLQLARQEGDIQVLREAPPQIQRLAEKADPLPGEILDIAHKMVHGQWPGGWTFAPPRNRTFKSEIPEHVPA